MNQLTPQQAQKALQLRQEGYSLRDIAAELDVNKSKIEKLLVEQNAIAVARTMIGQQLGIDQPAAGARPVPIETSQLQRELESERTRLAAEARRLADWEQQLLRQSTSFRASSSEHSRELNELAQQTAILAQERSEFDRRQTEQQQQLQATPGQEQAYEAFRIRARQDKLVSQYNRMIQDLLDSCDDCRWSGDEVDDYLERAETLKAKIVAFCNAHRIDERRLLMYVGLDYLINDIEEEKDEQTSGFFQSSSVDFDYSPEYQTKLKAYMVETFEQPAPMELTKPNLSVPVNMDDEDEDE